MFLELTLTEDDPDFGHFGEKTMINDAYIVGVSREGNGSKVFIDMSDLGVFKTLHVAEKYEQWFILRLNP